MNENLVALENSARPAKEGAQRLRDLDPATPVEVTVTLRGPDLPDPGQPGTQAVDRDEFARRFGASQSDADATRRALEGYGLTVDEVSLAARSLRVSGTAAQMEAAFDAGLGVYRSPDQGEFRGREGQLSVPSELAGIVTGVFGLDERRVARRAQSAVAAAPAVAPLRPADFESRYSFPPGDGRGQQIGIAEFGGGYFAGDLQAYCQREGRAVPSVTTVPLGIPALTLDQLRHLPKRRRMVELDESVEVMMDVEIIAGLCPGAQIFVYFAPFTQKGWVDLLNSVVSGRPGAPRLLSVSWGLAEDAPDWSPAARTAINARLQAAAAVGVTVCVASGDDGTGDQLTDGRAHVNFPASSPYVLAVGGTMLTDPGGEEVVWWEAPGERTQNGGGSTGGGVSTVFARPAWQSVNVVSINQPPVIDGRVVPDVAALSGPPFYDLIFLGQPMPNGGTSASAPLWAAVLARIAANTGRQLPWVTPLLYRPGAGGGTKPLGATACNDITVGDNHSSTPGIGYQAGAGYDAVTGWGTPDGTKLAAGI